MHLMHSRLILSNWKHAFVEKAAELGGVDVNKGYWFTTDFEGYNQLSLEDMCVIDSL